MKQLCEQCEKRPAKMMRRSHKYRGAKSNLIIKADKRHSMCLQCWRSLCEPIRQQEQYERYICKTGDDTRDAS